MRDELARVLRAGGGALSRRQHPELAGAIDYALRNGRIRAVLPGVYVPAEEGGLEVDLLAATLWHPEASFVGAAAARLTFWPELRLDRIELASPTSRGERRGRFVLRQRRIPPDLIRQVANVTVTTPALTALDLCDSHGGDGIDTVLRTRATTVNAMWEVLASCPGRRGNRERRALLLDSRAEPWSAAERLQHRLLRAAKITGWIANHPVRIGKRLYFLDVGFPRQLVAIEIDGRSAHGVSRFEADRWRQNDLILAGWTVLRFTWSMLVDDPEEVIRLIRVALAGSV